MALPSKELLRGLVSKVFYGGRACSFDTIVKRVKDKLEKSGDFDLKKKNRSGTEFAWIDRLKNVLRELKREKLVSMTKSKRYGLTEAGKKIFADETPNVEEVPSEPIEPIKPIKPIEPIEQPPSMQDARMSTMVRDAMRLTGADENFFAPKRTTVPKREEIKPILLRSMQDNRTYSRQNFRDIIRVEMNLSDAVLEEKYPSGIIKWSNEVDWAVRDLKDAKLILWLKQDCYRITEAGKKFLSAQ